MDASDTYQLIILIILLALSAFFSSNETALMAVSYTHLAAGLAVSITAQFFAAKASVGFATELRQAVYDHVQKLSYTELDTLGTDTLITRLTDDINQVQNGVNMGLRLLLRSPFIVLGSMVMEMCIRDR